MKYYVMVTDYINHWHLVKNAYYTSVMVKFGKKILTQADDLDKEIQTIFIKKNKNSGSVENTWIGKSYNYKSEVLKDLYKIKFDVKLTNEINCPETLKGISNGWYLMDIELNMQSPTSENKFIPSIFNDLKSADWQLFEDGVKYLLRGLGVHIIHCFPRTSQKGQADGIFMIDNTVVLYDCTLDENFHTTKSQQIENFINQLSKSEIKIGKKEFKSANCDKYVWVITKNSKSQVLRSLDNILVKEVPVEALVQLYLKRFTDITIDEKELERLIQNI